jgi:hypothetical protein
LDSSKLSAYLSIQRTLHEANHVDIKMLCLLLTGSTGEDDVAHSHTDPSYRVRNKAYDKDSPDEVRSKAIKRRQECRHLEQAPVECRELVLVASEGTITHASMQADLQTAKNETHKRTREIFEAETAAERDDALDYIDAIAPEPGTSEDVDGNDGFDDQF